MSVWVSGFDVGLGFGIDVGLGFGAHRCRFGFRVSGLEYLECVDVGWRSCVL
jgi:hypothetical protein